MTILKAVYPAQKGMGFGRRVSVNRSPVKLDGPFVIVLELSLISTLEKINRLQLGAGRNVVFENQLFVHGVTLNLQFLPVFEEILPRVAILLYQARHVLDGEVGNLHATLNLLPMQRH